MTSCRYDRNWPEDQKIEGEVVKRFVISCPADYCLQKSEGLLTKAERERTDDLILKMDAKLWHRLPEDLLPKIFARLPFRSLFKICLLSKAWEANIQSPSFRMEATAEVLSKWESYSPVVCNEDLQLVAYSRFSQQWQRLFSLSSYLFAGARSSSFRWQTVSIAGSLLCLKQRGEPGQRGILVTNPLLKSWRLLPPHGSTTRFLPNCEIIHLVAAEEKDSSTYKVISISQDSSIRDPSKHHSHSHLIPPQPHQQPYHEFQLPCLRAEIYDSTTRAWRVDENGPLMPMDIRIVSSVYLDGIMYFSVESIRRESFHLFAYNARKGSWSEIPCPKEASRSVQFVRCGARVMVVLHFSASANFRPLFDLSSCKISENSIDIYEIWPDFKITKVSGGPVECIRGLKIEEGISGDEECIYLQAFGCPPVVVVFNVRQKLWSTASVAIDSNHVSDESQQVWKLSSRYFGPSFNWTNSSFHPSLNSFAVP